MPSSGAFATSCEPFSGTPVCPLPACEPVPPGDVYQRPAFAAGFPQAVGTCGPWCWELLPDGLIYHSYLAGVKEPRMQGLAAYSRDRGWFLDGTVGGRVGLLRYGTSDTIRPQGYQVDLEGAAFPRINLADEWDLESADFRIGVPFTYGIGQYQMKLAFYHLSSHLGDEYMIKHPTAVRINYSRDAFVWGHSYYLDDDWRIYGEVGWASYSDGGSKPWEFQAGIEYSPLYPWYGHLGAPFLAFNAASRQDVDYKGNIVLQGGWQWRGPRSGDLFRLGAQYFNGKSSQFEFFNRSEQFVALGAWYDF